MARPLLKTKLYVPPIRPRVRAVPRPRLIARLNDGIRAGSKVTLISAPAGFGKTTLVSDWTGQADRPVAWVSLDEGDNDPARLWSYVIAALQTVQAGLGAASLAALQSSRVQLSTPTEPQGEGKWIETLLTGLINELAECSAPLVLVLDDLQAITQQQNHDALVFLVADLPPQVHLVLSTRTDPPWPLARMRVRGEMTELRAKDLRFTLDETATFLNDVIGLQLPAEDVAALDARTEGWVAGLQMAALSMREHRDRKAFIQSLGGTHRFILDYLVEEVLGQQPNEVQEFMLRTSILTQMTAPLCDALTGMDDGQVVLVWLERANLFLTPLDDDRRWYRYHHLFAELLRSRLEQTQPDLVPSLHRRASEWYAQNDLVVDAVSHALAARDVDRAAGLIAENALATIYQGELATVIGWLEALPKEMVRTQPWLCIARAWALAYAGRLDAVEPVLLDGQRPLNGSVHDQSSEQASGLGAVEQRRIRGHSAAIRAYAAFLRWDRLSGMACAREALVFLPEQDLAVRGLAAMVLAMGLYGSGDLDAAERAFAEAITASRAANDWHVAANALCELADLQVAQGQLHKSAATCREALQMVGAAWMEGGGQLPISGYAYGRLSVVLREWNDLPDAVQYARRCVELSQRWGQVDALILGHVFLAGALVAADDMSGAWDAMQEAKRIASEVSPRYEAFVAAKEARLRLATGDVTGATRWVQESGLHPSDEPCRPIVTYISLARVLIARALHRAGDKLRQPGDTSVEKLGSKEAPTLTRMLDEALALLARLLSMADGAGADGYSIEILILQATAFQARGKPDRALAALERALCLAEPEGYVRTFADESAPVGVLLRQAAAQGIKVDYVRMLLEALEGETRAQDANSSAHLGLAEPLSERELEVLRLLAIGMPNKGIAHTLVIAVGTVKQHLKNIYGKLEVHNRTEATNRARDLGLV